MTSTPFFAAPSRWMTCAAVVLATCAGGCDRRPTDPQGPSDPARSLPRPSTEPGSPPGGMSPGTDPAASPPASPTAAPSASAASQ